MRLMSGRCWPARGQFRPEEWGPQRQCAARPSVEIEIEIKSRLAVSATVGAPLCWPVGV